MADFSLRQIVPLITSWIHDFEDETENNHDLFDIFEGDLLKHLEADLQQEMSPGSYRSIKPRITPINVLKRIINKLSKVYVGGVTRTASTEDPTDQELVEWYEEQMRMNTIMQEANKFFNLFKNTAIEPYVDKGRPSLRTIPSNQFLPYTMDEINPMNMQAFVKFLGVHDRQFIQSDRRATDQREVNNYEVYTDDQFLIIDDDDNIRFEKMIDNPEGINPFGKIPFVYVNRSRHKLVPFVDSDTLSMSKNIPKLYSDLAYAVRFQAFSMVYAINAKLPDTPVISPSVIWELQQVDTDQPITVDTIKPSIDISETIELIKALTSDWLESRGLRPGAIRPGSGDNALSGISMMIQNMDTTEDRREQVEYFREAERDLWDLISKHMHPVWTSQGVIDERRQFSADFEINVEFAEPRPFKDKEQIIKEQRELLDAGLTIKEKAIMEIFDDMTEEEVRDMVQEINKEKRENFTSFVGEMPNAEVDEEEEEAEEA